MTKILLILHLPPPIHGASVVGNYIKSSQEINNTFRTAYINLSTSGSLDEIGRKSAKKVFKYFSLLCKVIGQLITFKPDLCYFSPTAYGPGFYKDALVITIVKVFGVKRILHYHNKGVSYRYDRLFDNLLYINVLRRSNLILLSNRLYPEFNRYVPETSVFYCPNGIPDIPLEWRNRKAKKSGAIASILFISNLIKSKGILVLLEACAILKAKEIDFYCTIAGGDAQLSKVDVEKILVNSGLSAYISVVGPQYDEDKIDLFSRSDIFVLPTYEDIFGLVNLEAMQFSLPIVSTYEGAIPDVVEDGITGFLVPKKDPVSLAEKLEILIKDPELRDKMGAAGREKFEREFTLDRFEIRLAEILDIAAND